MSACQATPVLTVDITDVERPSNARRVQLPLAGLAKYACGLASLDVADADEHNGLLADAFVETLEELGVATGAPSHHAGGSLEFLRRIAAAVLLRNGALLWGRKLASTRIFHVRLKQSRDGYRYDFEAVHRADATFH